jgi:hypothetical protein
MTWADILGAESKEYYNFANCGCGNQQIFIQLIECIKRYNLTEGDTVIIMWTSVAREDRFVKGKWICPGNIYHQEIYPREFVEKFVDMYGYLKRDLSFISATKLILENLKINYHFLSMIPVNQISEWHDSINDNTYDELFKLYENDLKTIRSSVFEIIFNSNWRIPKRQPRPRHIDGQEDFHPTPYEHLEYIKNIFPELSISEKTLNLIDKSQKECKF